MTTPDQELRAMIGDLFVQVAVLRAENISLKEQLGAGQPRGPDDKRKPNGPAAEESQETGALQ